MKKTLFIGLVISLLVVGVLLGANSQATTTISVTAPTFDSACMQSATSVRDDAIIAAIGPYSSAVSAALAVRRDALNVAWGNTDPKARNAALKAATNAYGKSIGNAKKTLAKAKAAAWKTYQQTVKNTCKTSQGSVTSTTDPL